MMIAHSTQYKATVIVLTKRSDIKSKCKRLSMNDCNQAQLFLILQFEPTESRLISSHCILCIDYGQ